MRLARTAAVHAQAAVIELIAIMRHLGEARQATRWSRAAPLQTIAIRSSSCAVDGVGPEHDQLRRDLEDLSSPNFAAQLRQIVTTDDAVAKNLMDHANGQQASAIGRRVDARIELDLLDDEEFDTAAESLWDHRMAVMHGGRFAPELRVPWILRALGGRYAPQPGEKPDKAAVLPTQLSLDLIGHTRQRFTDDELRRAFREIAKAVLLDAEDTKCPIALLLESLATFVVRRPTLRKFLELSEIDNLIARGFLKPAIHRSGDAVLFVRLPELLASEASGVLAAELIKRARKKPAKAAAWMVALTSRLPLGDIIAAYAFIDAAADGGGGVPFNLVAALRRSSGIMVWIIWTIRIFPACASGTDA